MQTPEPVAPERLVTVVFIRADASSAITSEHAFTAAIVAALLGVGDGDGLAFADGEFDEPHAPSRRPAETISASTPLDRGRLITR